MLSYAQYFHTTIPLILNGAASNMDDRFTVLIERSMLAPYISLHRAAGKGYPQESKNKDRFWYLHGKPLIMFSLFILRHPSASRVVEGTLRKLVMQFRCVACHQLYWFHIQPSMLSQFSALCFHSSLFPALFFFFFLKMTDYWLEIQNT